MYLHPVMSFVDEHCHIFSQEDENAFTYTRIHDEFKDVVDALLTDFLEELGVAPEVGHGGEETGEKTLCARVESYDGDR